MNRNVVIATVVVVLLLVVGFLAYQNFNKPTTTGSAQNIDVTGYPAQGDPNSKVTVVAFEDFKCPVCQQYDKTVVPNIEQKYVETNKIKYVFVDFPIIAAGRNQQPDDSRLAANAGYCVADQSNKAFFNYAHILFQAQKDEMTVWATNDYLKELAQTLEGVDQTKLAQCIDGGTNNKKVEAGNSLALKLNVTGTPTVFVNGKSVTTPWTGDNVDKAIAAALGQ